MLNIIFVFESVSCLHSYCCAGCQAKSRIWALVGRRDNQCVVSVADLVVQLFYCSDPPLNAHHTHKVNVLFLLVTLQ